METKYYYVEKSHPSGPPRRTAASKSTHEISGIKIYIDKENNKFYANYFLLVENSGIDYVPFFDNQQEY